MRRYILATAFGLALEAIRVHKLRSFLTLLGVIVGVAGVVAVGAAIEGLGAWSEESTAKVFGSETYLVAQVARAVGRKEYYDKLKRNKPLRQEDLAWLVEATGDRVLYSAYMASPGEVKLGAELFDNAQILGVSATMGDLRDAGLADGRFFTAEEERMRQSVAVIGDEIRRRLFPGAPAIGGRIKVSGTEFAVVGVQGRIGYVLGQNRDNVVFIPVTVHRRLFGLSRVSVFGRARPGTGLTQEEALDLTRVALRTRFRIRPGRPDRFDSVTPDAIRAWTAGILDQIESVAVPVTCLSLLVGAIVIMNIMLVSVNERTSEIGIRKSVGARQSDIRLQFLIEALLLSVCGGALGVAAGAGLAYALEGSFGIATRITAPYVALGLLLSLGVGVLAGWYPAVRAARLDPVAALRAEAT